MGWTKREEGPLPRIIPKAVRQAEHPNVWYSWTIHLGPWTDRLGLCGAGWSPLVVFSSSQMLEAYFKFFIYIYIYIELVQQHL